MKLSAQIANQFREVQLNGKWIATNLKTEIADVNLDQATTKVGTLNTIAALAYHVNYYIAGLIEVFEGDQLNIRDKYSFDLPPLKTETEWDNLKKKIWQDAERFAELVEQMPDEKLFTGFVKEEYGTYFRNIVGMIEHAYYHLGQVVILKKLINDPDFTYKAAR
ncbi:MAG: DinB family protein, partial [Bacteroidota bacterium]